MNVEPDPGRKRGSASILALLSSILVLECALAFGFGALVPYARGWTPPPWLVAGAPPAEAPSIWLAALGLALTTVVRFLQVALACIWVRRAQLQSETGLAFAWGRRSLAVAAGSLAFVACGAAMIEAVCRLWLDVRFVQDVLLGGGAEPAFRAAPYFALTLLATGLVGPVAEEVVCRGLVYVPLRRRYGVVPGLLVSAALFTAIHRVADPIGSILIAVGGMMFAAACELGRGLAAPVVFHSVYNSALTLLRHPDLSAS